MPWSCGGEPHNVGRYTFMGNLDTYAGLTGAGADVLGEWVSASTSRFCGPQRHEPSSSTRSPYVSLMAANEMLSTP